MNQIDRVGAPDHDLSIRGETRSVIGLLGFGTALKTKNLTVGGR